MNNPTLHSHTHCKVAQADTQAKTWQRVWLSNRTAKRHTEKEKEPLAITSVAVAQLQFLEL